MILRHGLSLETIVNNGHLPNLEQILQIAGAVNHPEKEHLGFLEAVEK
jgi:hypothetical protein